MTKSPILNALTATLYIVFVACILFYGTRSMGRADTIVAPIAGISLFTLSAAVMGYIFCYQPIQLYFDNKKKEAVNLFLHTVGVFGAITALAFLLLMSGIMR